VEYIVAAPGYQWIDDKRGLGRGRKAKRPPRKAALEPFHAVLPGDDKTACGNSLDGLEVDDDMGFPALGSGRCRDCIAAVTRP